MALEFSSNVDRCDAGVTCSGKKSRPSPASRTPHGEGRAGLKGRAIKRVYPFDNACAKWTAKGGRRRKMRVGEVSGVKRLGDRGRSEKGEKEIVRGEVRD